MTFQAFLFLASAVRQAYLPLKMRIRQFGSLPTRRGPTILITNHQYEDEGEIVYARVFLKDPHVPVATVNSRRTFETGFLAARLPWTSPLTRRINPGPFWSWLGILPVENHLHSRALLSLAEEIRKTHGDLPLEAVLPDEVLDLLDVRGARLAQLWSLQYFTRAQTPVKLAHLKTPYRREAIENFRTTVAADIANAVERVRKTGATFYVTPEGDFSRDGFLRPMRNGITDAMLPVAEPWLCAIAYDPFRGRRLSMLYRIVAPADRDDLGTSLAAARPVTASALLATFLSGAGETFAASEAREHVRAQVAALPPNVFADPELRHPDTLVDEALRRLERLGFLAREGERRRLTGNHTDARFPHVADMVTYQRNMLEETLASAARLQSRAPSLRP